MYKEKIANDLQPKEANSKEMHGIEVLAALDCQLSQYEKHLKERLQSVPSAWQQFRMGKAGVANAVNAVYGTLPVKSLVHMQRLCEHGEVIIRQRGAVKTDDVQFVPTDGLKLLVNIAMENECAICMKDRTGQRKCELRKALMLMVPPDRVTQSKCAYQSIVSTNALGDYIK